MKPCKGCKTVKACIQKGKCLGKEKKAMFNKEGAKTSPSGGGY